MSTPPSSRYQRARQKVFAAIGRACILCGATDDLQVDHIDPEQKTFDVGKRWGYSFEHVLAPELEKCQVLCGRCHREKHATAKNSHGTISSFRYCRCDLCRKAKATHNRAYRAAHGIPPRRRAQVPTCGTRAAYTRKGCRCEKCRAAQRDYMRGLRLRKEAALERPQSPPT